MGLGVAQQTNATTYLRTGEYFSLIEPNNRKIMFRINGSLTRPQALYLDKLNLYQCGMMDRNIAANVNYLVRFDPFLSDPTPPLPVVFPETGIFGAASALWALQAYHPIENAQELYLASSTGTTVFDRMAITSDPTQIAETNPFPNVGYDNPSVASGLTTGDTGYYDFGSSDETNWIFFRGWDRLDSGNTVGTAFRGGGSLDADGTPAKSLFVDMSTGIASFADGLTTLYVTSPSEFQSGELFGDQVKFNYIQWLPDPQSTPNAPKGRIFMSGTIRTGTVTGKIFIKEVAFNPRGIGGLPLRTHLEIELLTRFIFVPFIGTPNWTPDPGTTSDILCVESLTTEPKFSAIFNPLTGRPVILGSGGFLVDEAEYDNPFTNPYIQSIIEMTPAPILDALSAPKPRQDPEVNRVTVFGVEAQGDLGELIPSVDVTWTLEAISTKAEPMNTPPAAPADPYTVVNGVIDQNTAFPFEVRQAGTPLVEGVDFDVITGGTQIDFLIALDGADQYEIDYAHPLTTVSPSFGILLSAESTTNTDGQATTRVRYTDDDTDAGFVDQITATAT